MSNLSRYDKKVKKTTDRALSLLKHIELYLPDITEIELIHILNKTEKAKIKENFFDIMKKVYPTEYNSKQDIEFFEKYKGTNKYVYEWCNDWWICEDDNYPLTIDCFEFIS